MAKWPRFDPDADRRLAKALSEGGEESLAALYDIYAERLRDYCGSLVRDKRLATDIVHDTLIDAHRRIRRMRDRTRLRAWLYAAVRRRCLQRVRHPALRWDDAATPATNATNATNATGDATGNDDETRELLRSAFDRLGFLEQESLLLSLRHDLTGDDLGALLGIPARRAGARNERAKLRAEGALDKARRTLAQRCANCEGNGAGTVVGTAAARPLDAEARHAEARHAEPGTVESAATGPDPAKPDAAESGRTNGTGRTGGTDGTGGRKASLDDGELADHMSACSGCRQRTNLSLAALLDLMPAAPLPSSLRHRVIHTGTDPELAGYRADITARGGTLNADGFPRQPDIPSHFARRWLFTTGGMVGAAVTAVVAAFLIGPGGPIPGLIWPSYRPEPSITPAQPARRQPPAPVGQPPGGQPPGGIPGDGAAHDDRPGSRQPTTRPPTGILIVLPVSVDLGAKATSAELKLAASRAPIAWRADTSTSRIALSAASGKIAAGDTAVVKLRFRRGLIELPGTATITFNDSAGRRHVVTVVWAGSLL